MLILRYYGETEKHLVNFAQVSDHVVQVTGSDLPVKISGFSLSREDRDDDNWDYTGYTTVYRLIDNGVQYSDDESVYVPPKPPAPPEPPAPPTLEEVQQAKIAELSYMCNSAIVTGVDVEIGEETEHFSYGMEDQNNIKELFDSAVASKMGMYYHSDGATCKLYTAEQIISIYVACALNKTSQETYFNQLRLYVMNDLKTTEEVEAIQYGVTELEGTYLETYNAAIAQTQAVIQSILHTDPEEEVRGDT